MPQTCKLCRHPKRRDIDRKLVSGTPLRDIASLAGVGYESARRHRNACLPALLAKAEALEVTTADVLLEEIQQQKEEVDDLREKAKEDGDTRTALLAVDKSLKALDLQAKVSEVIASAPTINIAVHPRWLRIQGVLLEVLDPYPEVRAAISDRLLEIEGEPLPSSEGRNGEHGGH